MSDMSLHDDDLFERIAENAESAEGTRQASARLKSKLYSVLVRHQQASGPLLSLTETREGGQDLCVFERLWEILPLGNTANRFNCCSICHARILGERIERAPIYWWHCPYVEFGKK